MITGLNIGGAINTGQPVNWAAPLNRGLVSWWLARNQGQYFGGGCFLDLCRKNHATRTGVSWHGSLGRPGGCGSLNCGTNDAYAIVDREQDPTNLDFNRDFTLCAWARKRSNKDQAVFSHGSGGWYIGFQSSGKVLFNESQIAVILASTNTVASDAWTHIAATISSDATATVKVFINGLEDGSTTTGNTFNDAARYVTIGADNVTTPGGTALEEFDGYIDDVRAFNGAKSPGEIWQIYQDSRHGYLSTLNWLSRVRVAAEAGGGGGGLSIPVAMYNYRRLRVA